MPLLISTGGNSGSQSATLIIRGLAVGELRPRDWWRVLYREAGMGLTLGVGLGAIGFFRVLMYRDQHVNFALTVAVMVAHDAGPAPALLDEAIRREKFPKLKQTMTEARELARGLGGEPVEVAPEPVQKVPLRKD